MPKLYVWYHVRLAVYTKPLLLGGQIGHRKYDCPEARNFTANIICRVCGNAGHMARDCPDRQRGTDWRNGPARPAIGQADAVDREMQVCSRPRSFISNWFLISSRLSCKKSVEAIQARSLSVLKLVRPAAIRVRMDSAAPRSASSILGIDLQVVLLRLGKAEAMSVADLGGAKLHHLADRPPGIVRLKAEEKDTVAAADTGSERTATEADSLPVVRHHGINGRITNRNRAMVVMADTRPRDMEIRNMITAHHPEWAMAMLGLLRLGFLLGIRATVDLRLWAATCTSRLLRLLEVLLLRRLVSIYRPLLQVDGIMFP